MIPVETAKKVLAEALRSGGDLAEIYVEDQTSLTLNLEDSKIEKCCAWRGSWRGGARVFWQPCHLCLHR